MRRISMSVKALSVARCREMLSGIKLEFSSCVTTISGVLAVIFIILVQSIQQPRSSSERELVRSNLLPAQVATGPKEVFFLPHSVLF
jgi:hypothetical protein